MNRLISSILFVLLVAANAYSAVPIIDTYFRSWDSNSKQLAGGCVYTYDAGTTNKALTYSDSAGTVANANPIKLDATGKASIYAKKLLKIMVYAPSTNGLCSSTPTTTLISSRDNVLGTDGSDYQEYVPTISTLRSYTGRASSVYVKGFSSSGDGGEGTFNKKTGAIGTYTDDGGVIILPSGGDGSIAWVREYSGPVDVRWFGGVGDGIFNNTSAINSAVSSFHGDKGTVYFPAGSWIFNGIVCDDVAVDFVGDGSLITKIIFAPTATSVAFDLRHTKALFKAFAFRNLAIYTATAGGGTAIKITTKMDPNIPTQQVNGQRDSLILNNVRIHQLNTGYWNTFIHSVNNGGISLSDVTMDNHLEAAQADPTVIGINIEVTDNRASVIRALTADGFFILRAYTAIKLTAGTTLQIESTYLSNGEIVGGNCIKAINRVGAVRLDGLHINSTGYTLDASESTFTLARFTGNDFRKSDNGGTATPGPMFIFDNGESVTFSGNTFSGIDDTNHSTLNRVFTFDDNITGVAMRRMAINGNTFRLFNTVYGITGNAEIVTAGNVYHPITTSVIEDTPFDHSIAFQDARISKSVVVDLNDTGSQTIEVPVSAKYFNGAWPIAFMQQASPYGVNSLVIRYAYELSDADTCVFVVTGNNSVASVRFSVIAMSSSEYVID